MEKIIVVDCGKDETKVVVRNDDGTNKKEKIPTRVAPYSELTSMNKEAGADLHVVEYEGKRYSVGDPSGRTSDSNSKMDETHRVMTISSIAMNVGNGDTVKIAIGCPLSVYVDKQAREEYLNYILPQGRVNITVDGEEKYFYITFRVCFAESLGAVFLYPEKFKDAVVGVVDIGGLNINCAYFDNGKLVVDSCFTDKFGKLHIARKLRSVLNQKFDAQFAEFEVERIMMNGYVTNAEEESKPIIERALSDDLVEIENACKNNGWNIRFCSLIFIGGTSQILRGQIKEKFPNAFIPDDSGFANAEGFMRALCMQLRVGV